MATFDIYTLDDELLGRVNAISAQRALADARAQFAFAGLRVVGPIVLLQPRPARPCGFFQSFFGAGLFLGLAITAAIIMGGNL